jgi:hypothetical protein
MVSEIFTTTLAPINDSFSSHKSKNAPEHPGQESMATIPWKAGVILQWQCGHFLSFSLMVPLDLKKFASRTYCT